MLLAVSLLVLLVTPAWGATYYVSTTGADTNPGTIDQPWRTVQKAAQMMYPGDTTYVRGGTYVENNIQFTNSGNESQRITLRGYPGETAVIDGGATGGEPLDVTFLPIFDIDGRSYITIRNLSLTKGKGSGIRLGYNYTTEHVWILENDISFTSHPTGDNSGGVYIGTNTNNIRIIRNTIHDYLGCTSPSLTNCSGIIMFHPRNIEIRQNHIWNMSNNGIYLKHNSNTGYRVILRDNYIHGINTTDGTGIKWTGSNGQIYNNVIAGLSVSSQKGIRLFEESAVCNALVVQDNAFVHNTIVNTSIGIHIDRSSCIGAIRTLVQDNIVHKWTQTDHRAVSIYRYGIGRWAASTAYTLGNLRTPLNSYNEYRYKVNAYLGGCTGPCTSGSTEPLWPTTVGATVNDGDVQWINDGFMDTSETTLRNNLLYNTIGQANEVQVHDLAYSIEALPSTILGRTGNLDTAPTFIDETGGDYRLAPASNGKGAAFDGLDMGACMAYGVPAACVTASSRAVVSASVVMDNALRVENMER